jgi:molybdopterin-binding protein
MQLSARNQLRGTVTVISSGAVMALVTSDLDTGNEIVAAITVASDKRLGLEIGSEAISIIKATEVMATTP